jgi:hypothetical protein
MLKNGLLLLFCFTPFIGYAQFQQTQAPRFASLYIESNFQPQQNITDSANNTFSFRRVTFGAVLPLLHRSFAPANDTLLPNRLGVSINPSLGYSELRLSYFPQERLLINHQLALSTYYFYKQKNALTLNLRALYNEDEFTMKDAKLRYNASFIYTRKVSPRFSYYAGGGYGYVLGEGVALPLLGARFSWARSSRLNILLPLQVSFRTGLNAKTRLTLYAHPEGGVNRFENRLNISDTAIKTIMLRRRSLAIGAALSWHIRNNLVLVVDPAVLLGRQISFTPEGEQSPDAYISNRVQRGLQLELKLIWRPWQNTLRNQRKMEGDLQDDDNFILGF